jgi:competence protein ComEA
MKDIWKVAFGTVCGLLGAAIILIAVRPPRGNVITLSPPPTPEPIQVYITGAVGNPGVYSLPHKSRVDDAIQAAGGLLPQANAQNLNLAAFLQEGTHIRVPYLPTAIPTGSSPIVPSTQGKTTTGEFPININTASQEELEMLPQIGPVIAANIIEYRTTHGPFETIDAIQNVSGIGPKTFDEIKELIIVEISP